MVTIKESGVCDSFTTHVETVVELRKVQVYGKRYYLYRDEEHFPLGRIDFYNLILVTEGAGIHEIDFFDYNVQAGELLITSKKHAHRYSDYDGLEGFLIMFTDDFIHKFLGDHAIDVTDLLKQTYLSPQINSLDSNGTTLTLPLDVMHEMYTNDDGGIDDEVIAPAFRTLVLLISNICLGRTTSKQKNNEISNELGFTEVSNMTKFLKNIQDLLLEDLEI